MSSSPAHWRVAGLLVIAALVLACGATADGSDPPDATGADASTITISGSATGRIGKPGGCGKAISDADSWEVTFATDEPGWMLDATVEATKEPGGTYQTGFHKAGAVTVLLYQGSGGTSFDSSTGSGSITVDDGADSGSIDVTVTDATSGKTARAVGGWTCENWD